MASNHRMPLGNISNAVNSPVRAKRPRAADDLEQPPAKKKYLADGRVLESRPDQGYIDRECRDREFQRKLMSAARDKLQQRQQQQQQTQKQIPENDRIREETAESLKQWRRHYAAIFPKMVFFFESISSDIASRASKAINQLGAREEKFFSHQVTHVITTREIPPGPQSSDAFTLSSSSRYGDSQSQSGQAKTINPSLLDKQRDIQWTRVSQQKNSTVQDLMFQRRPIGPPPVNSGRRPISSQADVLVKARDMGKKIWTLEKFERIIATMLRPDFDGEVLQPSRNAVTQLIQPAQPQETDLSQLLRNERNLPSDRLPWTDLVPFTGFYIYIHDAEEKMRPVMIREYKNPGKDMEGNALPGEWPHLNAVPEPRCPFVAEHHSSKHDETERDPQAPAEIRRPATVPLEKVVSVQMDHERMMPAPELSKKRPMTFDPPRTMARPGVPPPPRTCIEPPTLPQYNANYNMNQSNTTDGLPPQNRWVHHMKVNPGREPLASGLQQSNHTSAIRSQVISSTSSHPVPRRVTTKDMYDLKKRAVERSRDKNPIPNPNDIRAAINQPASVPSKTSRSITRPTSLQRITEEENQYEEELNELSPKSREVLKKSEEEKVKAKLKPGYCENCREKYECFKEHIADRKHRAFATKADNWVELDHLLKKLARK